MAAHAVPSSGDSLSSRDDVDNMRQLLRQFRACKDDATVRHVLEQAKVAFDRIHVERGAPDSRAIVTLREEFLQQLLENSVLKQWLHQCSDEAVIAAHFDWFFCSPSVCSDKAQQLRVLAHALQVVADDPILSKRMYRLLAISVQSSATWQAILMSPSLAHDPASDVLTPVQQDFVNLIGSLPDKISNIFRGNMPKAFQSAYGSMILLSHRRVDVRWT